MIYFDNGDLLDCKCEYICHQVNCQAKMNSGIAKAIREKWPVVYTKYIEKCKKDFRDNKYTRQMLGDIQIIPIGEKKNVINMFGQDGYGYDGKRYTSYDAFWMCLGNIKNNVPKGSKIGFPAGIGSCRGGANWNIILAMIGEVLDNDYEVHIIYKENEE